MCDSFLILSASKMITLTIFSRTSQRREKGYFVAWDGNIIHDNPHSCKMKLKSNRTRRGSKATFRKLFLEKKISHADGSAV